MKRDTTERIAQLGGVAEGTVRVTAKRSRLEEHLELATMSNYKSALRWRCGGVSRRPRVF